ncbi:MFS transporter [bacterium]|nr:MFS transporter [bacterium]
MALQDDAATATPGDVPLDSLPLTRMHLFILLVCALGFSFDLAEIAFGGILSAIFSAPPNAIDPGELSWLLAAAYIGAIGGAPVLGWLADRHGRQRLLFWSLVIVTVTSFGAGFSPNFEVLILFRGLSGFALGAYPPLMISFMTDIFPAARRGPLVLGAVAIGYLGPPGLIFFVHGLGAEMPLGLAAWRWAFLIAGTGAALCAVLFRLVPESPRWLMSRGRRSEAAAAMARFAASPRVGRSMAAKPVAEDMPAAASMSQSAFVRSLAFLIVAYLLMPWATVGFSTLSGAVLVEKGINPHDSILYVGVSTFGPLIGTLIGGFLVDRVERRSALVLLAIGMGVLGIVFALVDDPVSLMATGLLFNLLVNLFTPVIVLYAAEMFTTDRRAQGASWGWAANRFGSALVPLALLPLLHAQGPLAMFGVIAVTLLAFVAVVLAFGPRGGAGRAVA